MFIAPKISRFMAERRSTDLRWRSVRLLNNANDAKTPAPTIVRHANARRIHPKLALCGNAPTPSMTHRLVACCEPDGAITVLRLLTSQGLTPHPPATTLVIGQIEAQRTVA